MHSKLFLVKQEPSTLLGAGKSPPNNLKYLQSTISVNFSTLAFSNRAICAHSNLWFRFLSENTLLIDRKSVRFLKLTNYLSNRQRMEYKLCCIMVHLFEGGRDISASSSYFKVRYWYLLETCRWQDFEASKISSPQIVICMITLWRNLCNRFKKGMPSKQFSAQYLLTNSSGSTHFSHLEFYCTIQCSASTHRRDDVDEAVLPVALKYISTQARTPVQ